ncbi:MAG: SDR family NAD(P)-dependent oxidoreductase [Planctomycetales bacterium]|nr:SDR family NAD(P)-dependent oxidoreductase [Planctomycetales bacterium]
MNLNGKVALVTGGTMGIGAAIAIDLARRGAQLSICARELGDDAKQTKSAIEAVGGKAHLMSLDMSKAEDCAKAVEQTASHFGRLDVLVHNAGGPSFGRIDEVTPEQWRQTMALHVDACSPARWPATWPTTTSG